MVIEPDGQRRELWMSRRAVLREPGNDTRRIQELGGGLRGGKYVAGRYLIGIAGDEDEARTRGRQPREDIGNEIGHGPGADIDTVARLKIFDPVGWILLMGKCACVVAWIAWINVAGLEDAARGNEKAIFFVTVHGD